VSIAPSSEPAFDVTGFALERHRISVAVPGGPAPAGGFPVVYVLDANANFGTVVEAVRRAGRRPDATGVVPAIVVGVAHDGATHYDPGRRRDFTHRPAAVTGAAPADDATGGADAFLRILREDLMPRILRDHPADPARQSLIGHSLAGLFALRVLTTAPTLFETYVAISPSIWWDEAGLLAGVQNLHGAPVRVFLAVGEWEEALPPWQRGAPGAAAIEARRRERRMVGRARAFAGALAGVLGEERVSFVAFPDEDHASVVPGAIARGLRVALRPG
jgi:predicted alpha/beta superfamily hydrolase